MRLRRWQSGGTALRLYYGKGADDLSFEVQHTTGLAPAGWTHDGVTAEIYDAGTGLFYQSAPVAPGEPAKFLRLQVAKP